ncbi:hypothetical protein FRC12_005061 [Ceratobasidium sp. 428]|nr:hypothetical protein FRC12_005061 [Ceratobasidium sp. 428]
MTAAFVWKHVPGAIHLLRPAPGAQCTTPSSISNHQAIKHDTSRLELYAPFVQSLEAYCPLIEEHWDQSLWRTYPLQTQQPVNFPKLRRLTYTSPEEKAEKDQLGYLLPFLSSSLREIEITACNGCLLWQSLSSVSKFLNVVSSQCPKLESLRIYPGQPSSNAELNEDFERATFTDDALAMHQTMNSFRGLRELAISPAVLEPNVLRAVSSYPYLETLIIRSKAYGGPVYDEYDLDDTSFPALQRLELIDLDPHVMKKLSDVKRLLCGLEHASIQFGPGSNTAWGFSGDRADSLFSLVKYCPNLTELKFDIGESKEAVSIPKLTDLFRPRPLRSVSLTASVSLTEHAGWAELFGALPLVEELHLPRNGFQYPELRNFAIMLPRLHSLWVYYLDFRPDIWTIAKDLESVPNPSQIPLRFRLNIDIFKLVKDYKIVARCLHVLWPNVVIDIKPHPLSPTNIVAADFSKTINRVLRELSAS